MTDSTAVRTGPPSPAQPLFILATDTHPRLTPDREALIRKAAAGAEPRGSLLPAWMTQTLLAEVDEPKRLARGRAALAGDAAHAASPMVGGGFRQGLYDVAALAQVMTGPATPGGIPGALGQYQELRLGPAARHVAVSEQATADYLAHVAAGRRS